jgi:glucan biosynthesis protein C
MVESNIMTAAPAAGGARMERVHALDSLRAFAMFLGVTLHAAIAYQVTQLVPWIDAERRSVAFDIHNLVVHGFRLQLFFLIAGFFSRLLYERHGPRSFLKNRARRILLPFLLGMLTIMPVTGLIFYYGTSGSMVYTLHVLRKSMGLVTAHLWFLEYLMIYILCAMVLAPLGTSAGRLLTRCDEWFASVLKSRWKPLALALLTLPAFSFSDNWADVGLPISIIPMPRVLVYYGVFFGCGWMLHRHAGLLWSLRRFLGWQAGLSVLLLGVLLALIPRMTQFDHPRYEWLKAAAMVSYNTFTWAAIFGLIALFLRFFNGTSERARYLADASYWFYLVHLPVVMVLQYAQRNSSWPAALQFIVVVAGTVLFCGWTYEAMVRYSWIGRMLNGPRNRPARRVTCPETVLIRS